MSQWIIPISLLLGWNAMVLFLYRLDKERAIKNRRRISEKTLLTSAFLMGGVGAFLGMKLFRHKTKHLNFRLMVPLALFINLGLLLFLLLNL